MLSNSNMQMGLFICCLVINLLSCVRAKSSCKCMQMLLHAFVCLFSVYMQTGIFVYYLKYYSNNVYLFVSFKQRNKQMHAFKYVHLFANLCKIIDNYE